jgi:hypothetical protein
MALGDDPNSRGRTLTGKDALGDRTTEAPDFVGTSSIRRVDAAQTRSAPNA